MLYRVTDPAKAEHALALCRLAAGGAAAGGYVPFEAPTSIDADTRFVADAVVSHKADGDRYSLALTEWNGRPVAFFVNRAEGVHTGMVSAPEAWFREGRVYEGELCRYLPEPSQRLFLVFNVLFAREPLHRLPYRSRLAIVERTTCSVTLANAADRAAAASSVLVSAHPRLHIVSKPCRPVAELRRVLEAAPPETFETDGLIFTPLDGPAATGRNPRLLKWKARHTVDARLVASHGAGRCVLEATDQGAPVPLRAIVAHTLEVTPRLASIMRGHRLLFGDAERFDEIVELTVGGTDPPVPLTFLRVRRDKRTPNDAVTVRRTVEAVAASVTTDALIRVYEKLSAEGDTADPP